MQEVFQMATILIRRLLDDDALARKPII